MTIVDNNNDDSDGTTTTPSSSGCNCGEEVIGVIFGFDYAKRFTWRTTPADADCETAVYVVKEQPQPPQPQQKSPKPIDRATVDAIWLQDYDSWRRAEEETIYEPNDTMSGKSYGQLMREYSGKIQ